MPATSKIFDTVIVGGGMSAARLLGALSDHGYTRSIAWISAERHTGYNRVLLPDYLSRACSLADLRAGDAPGEQANLSHFVGTAAKSVNLAQKEVHLSDGVSLQYQQLVIATGGTVPRLGIPGVKLPGVCCLRNLHDADTIRAHAAESRHAVVVGGGLLGLEAGKALIDLGLLVRVVHRQPHLLNRQLDAEGSMLLQQNLSRQGFSFSLGCEIAAISGSGTIDAVTLTNGEKLPADLLVLATGIKANDLLGQAAGLDCSSGILTNSFLESSAKGVYALGECARVDGQQYTLVEPIYAQAAAIAATLAGKPTIFVPPAPNTRLKVSGIQLFSSGDVPSLANAIAENIVISDADTGLYRRLAFVGDQLKAAILIGNITGARHIQDAIDTTINSRDKRHALAFGL